LNAAFRLAPGTIFFNWLIFFKRKIPKLLFLYLALEIYYLA
jgi:hypothetical protein